MVYWYLPSPFVWWITNPSIIEAVEPIWEKHPTPDRPHMRAETPEQQRLQSLLLSFSKSPLGDGEVYARCCKIRWLVRSILNQSVINGTPTVPDNPDIDYKLVIECLFANANMPYSRERLLRIYGDCESVERKLGWE